MHFSKIFIGGVLTLFLGIGTVAGIKKIREKAAASTISSAEFGKPPKVQKEEGLPFAPSPTVKKTETTLLSAPVQLQEDLPSIDRIYQLFTKGATKLPIVETITYTSQVSWLKGRPAWIADYASHYSTSTHFIARSINGKADYETKRICSGTQFNVFRKDKNFTFHLLTDLSLCKMGLYYIDHDTGERVLLKTYKVAVGKKGNTASGSLTPLGKYRLGDKIAVYRPGTMGVYQNRQVEMVQIFGSRWIPISFSAGSPEVLIKGLGINGLPWMLEKKTGQFTENRELLGKYETDGCIQMATPDIEELFAIVVTKPTVIEIVKTIKEAVLPGVEVASPMR